MTILQTSVLWITLSGCGLVGATPNFDDGYISDDYCGVRDETHINLNRYWGADRLASLELGCAPTPPKPV